MSIDGTPVKYSDSDYLIQIVDIISHTLMANSADLDQLASEEVN